MFGLDPQNIAGRMRLAGQPAHIPSSGESVLRGMVGFTLVSLGGFAPWVLAGRWFYRNVGEVGLYVACAMAFIALSGPLMHRLIIGPGSLLRFYKIFSLAFLAYSVVWTIGWMALRGTIGGVIASLAGMAVMGWILAYGFAAPRATLRIIGILFVTNAAGYFIGEWAHNGVLALKEGNALGIVLAPSVRSSLSKAAWGLFYGLGFGAGIGWAIYMCQAEARSLVRSMVAAKADSE